MYGIREISYNMFEIYDLKTNTRCAICHNDNLIKKLRLLTAFKNFYRDSSDNAKD